MTDAAIKELAARIGVREACEAVGAAQAGYYRRHRQSPAPLRAAGTAHRDRVQPRALTAAERTAILEVLPATTPGHGSWPARTGAPGWSSTTPLSC